LRALRAGGAGEDARQGEGAALKAVLDACVLYPTVLRELLQGAGEAGLFQPVFSDRILREWVLATAKLGPGAPALAEGEAATLRAAFPRALVPAHPEIEARLILPDPNDRHVLASAIASGADAIVTFNAQDFPGHVLAAEGIARRDPDGFLWELQSRHPEAMAAIVEAVRARAEAISGQSVPLKALLKRVRLYRLGKALGV
jgi:predicted nucleic acid-binding protein